MIILCILAVAVSLYWAGTRFYGGYLEKVFRLEVDRKTPAVEINDGRDYVPAKPFVLFAHHFAAIAGAGPIVGPTLAFAYGVVPGLVWVVLGAIFIGGVHDMSALFISVRERGQSIAEIARKVSGQNRFWFDDRVPVDLFVYDHRHLSQPERGGPDKLISSDQDWPAITLDGGPANRRRTASRTSLGALHGAPVDADDDFGQSTAADNRNVPEGEILAATATTSYTLMGRIGGIASTSVLFITICAPLLGWLIYRKNISAKLAYPIASVLCVASVVLGLKYPVVVTIETWRWFMTFYVVVASTIPVWVLLMPRDFVNVQILYLGVVGIFAGLLVAGVSTLGGSRTRGRPGYAVV